MESRRRKELESGIPGARASAEKAEGTPLVFLSDSEQATEALARKLGERLEGGEVLALDGELGSGKTTFVRGLAAGLGATDPVSSPSYTLMHEYRGRLPLYHYDAWMEGRERAFLEGGGLEWIGGEGVAAIEWAQRVRHLLPSPRLEIALEHVDGTRRRLRFSVSGRSARLDRLLQSLAGLEPP
jgi:tRNA threonylcarbamoyladenosine biosynthesis protein TsaE